jgi:hypothetical protein
MVGVDLERDQLAVCGKRTGEPDGRIAAKRPDFENAPCGSRLCEQVEKLSLSGRNIDRRKSRGRVRRKGIDEMAILSEKPVGYIIVDRGPLIIHLGKAHVQAATFSVDAS